MSEINTMLLRKRLHVLSSISESISREIDSVQLLLSDSVECKSMMNHTLDVINLFHALIMI